MSKTSPYVKQARVNIMPELYPEDQEKVNKYLSSPQHSVEREEFKPLRLLLIIFVVLVALTAVSYFVALRHGVI